MILQEIEMIDSEETLATLHAIRGFTIPPTKTTAKLHPEVMTHVTSFAAALAIPPSQLKRMGLRFLVCRG
jgi:hypothetical protein